MFAATRRARGCKAPILVILEASLDPGRAIAMLAGRTRATTLKRYITVFQQWRLWLLEAKQISPPGKPADLVDYLLAGLWEEFPRADNEGDLLDGEGG